MLSQDPKRQCLVRRLLREFAQAASRSRRALKDKFAALSIRKGHKKIHCRAGTQNPAHCLCGDQKQNTLCGQGGRLRGFEPAAQSTTLVEDVDQHSYMPTPA
jgi:hypothetical protein